jgi:hypothetical protein
MDERTQWIRETQESDGSVRWHEGTLSWLVRCMEALHGFANVRTSNGGKCVDVPGAQFAVLPKCPACYSEMTKPAKRRRRRSPLREPIQRFVQTVVEGDSNE